MYNCSTSTETQKKYYEQAKQIMGTIVHYDDFIDPDFRSKQEYPYSYDPICVYECKVEPTGWVYSDRLFSWYGYDVVRAKMQEYFGEAGEAGDYYSNRKLGAIQAFLQDVMNKPTLVITRMEEHCNQATGYPMWFFECAESI